MSESNYILIFAFILFIMFTVLSFMYIKNKKIYEDNNNLASVLSAIYQSMQDIMFCKDTNGKYISCNHGFEKLVARKEAEVIGMTLLDMRPIFVEDDATRQIMMDMDKRVIDENISLTRDEWFIYPDGTKKLMEIFKTPLISDGKVAGILIIAKDVTEQRAQVALLNSINSISVKLLQSNINTMHGDLLQSLGMLANAANIDRIYGWKIDVKDGMLYNRQIYAWPESVNDQAQYGSAAEMLYSRENMPEWYDKLSRGICVNNIVRELTEKEKKILQPQGVLSILLVPVFIMDSFWGFVGFDDCHSERIFAENDVFLLGTGSLLISSAILRHESMVELEHSARNAHEANKAKSDFLAQMSHEIRTPMNAIIGMTELAMRETKLETALEYFSTVKQAGANLLSIINDILDFSKIERGQMIIVSDDYLFSSLLNDVISIIRMKVIDSQVRFVVNVDGGIPNTMHGDELKIRQVLINLLVNAVKYTQKGFVSLTVCGEMSGEDTIILTMEIMDSGAGIKEEEIEGIFDDYAQGDLGKNRGIEGTGLGLAITHSMIKAMDGEISVESEYGKGSLFTIKLPQKLRGKEKLASVENPDEKSVLIYDHRNIYANSLVCTMDNLGVNCVVAISDVDMQNKMSANTYKFIFISFALYKRNKNTILKHGVNAKVVLLAEFGETVLDKNLSVLAMPVHAISIANILNEKTVQLSQSTVASGQFTIGFTAPKAKVLVVDDINTNLKVTSGLLRPYKIQVDMRDSGMAAIEAIESKSYDLVFMDHRMPVMDGVETTQRIRAKGVEDTYYKNVPIIALTANAVSGTREMFLKNGFDDYMSKPIDIVKLGAILEKWIPKWKQVGVSAEGGGAQGDEPETAPVLDIDGLNVKKGMAIAGGTKAFYLDTLAIFCEDVNERTKTILKSLQAGDMSMYVTCVHALKGAAANIGADELFEAAKALETAGRAGDTGFIEARNAGFLTALESIVSGIKRAVIPARGTFDGNEEVNADTFRAALIELKTALQDMHAGAINSAIDGLTESARSGDASVAVGNISNHILMAEFDEALSMVESLLKRDGLS